MFNRLNDEVGERKKGEKRYVLHYNFFFSLNKRKYQISLCEKPKIKEKYIKLLHKILVHVKNFIHT